MKASWENQASESCSIKNDPVSNKSPRILIAILSHSVGSYDMMRLEALNTCYQFPNYHSCTIPWFLFGNDRKQLDNHKFLDLVDGVGWTNFWAGINTDIGSPKHFYYNVPESRYTLLSKTIGFFEYALSNKASKEMGFDWDFIYRTTLGSYVDTHKLYKLCDTLQREKVYLGHKTGPFPKDAAPEEQFSYVSGSGILMSRDVVSHIYKNKDRMNYNGNRIVKPWSGDDPQKDVFLDDVEIGRVLSDYCDITEAAMPDISLDDINNPDFSISPEEFHFHFRSSAEPRCFQALHRKINESKF